MLSKNTPIIISIAYIILGSLNSFSFAQKDTVRHTEIVSTQVKRDEVTLRVKTTGENNQPIIDLKDTDFGLEIVDSNSGEILVKKDDNYPFKWKSPQEATSPPAWIIVLLDFSGSMQCSQDLSSSIKDCSKIPKGKRKLDAALEALKTFITLAAERKGNTQIAIVPFGEAGPGCPGYPINSKQDLDKFYSVTDVKLSIFLDNLAAKTPCASTNLYQPAQKASQLLKNLNDDRFHPKDEEGNPIEPLPRLSIILLSDGFHTGGNDEEELRKLKEEIPANNSIIVHTLGYGLTPEQLGKKYNLNTPATRYHINRKLVPAAEFVDQEALAKIAEFTGGITAFAAEPEEIAEKLQLFLDAILGEYEITYIQPKPERAKTYQVTVFAQNFASKAKDYRITVFGRIIPLKYRIIMIFIIFLLLGVGGAVPFYYWGKKLKEQ